MVGADDTPGSTHHGAGGAVALMGCAVNGPGEAAGADLGVSLGRGRAHLFKRGKIVRTVPEDQIVEAVLEAIETWEEEPAP
ncbi:MAG: hypothetical protein KatS3mg042_0237 [Rhodothermaceae bacterium]|nr:MAG: hypothetical protein KatS3mg042_0237 [Rhodothermaceae bacterium]